MADVPVRHLLMGAPERLGDAVVLAGPPPADLDVVAVTFTVGHLVGGDVGEIEERLADPLPLRLGLGR